jgi:hypothetical protein
MQQLEESGDLDNVDCDKIFYYASSDRGVTISHVSNDKSSFNTAHGVVLEIDPTRIDAIRFGFDTNNGDKGVWEARYVHDRHYEHGGWYPVIRQSLIGVEKDLLAKAQKNPMETVELADGARKPTADGSLACGLAHSSISPCPVVFRADRSGDAVTCVLAAFGNVISMSIDANRKGLSLIRSKIENNMKLLSKDAGTLVMGATGVQTAKIKKPIGELYQARNVSGTSQELNVLRRVDREFNTYICVQSQRHTRTRGCISIADLNKDICCSRHEVPSGR